MPPPQTDTLENTFQEEVKNIVPAELHGAILAETAQLLAEVRKKIEMVRQIPSAPAPNPQLLIQSTIKTWVEQNVEKPQLYLAYKVLMNGQQRTPLTFEDFVQPGENHPSVLKRFRAIQESGLQPGMHIRKGTCEGRISCFTPTCRFCLEGKKGSFEPFKCEIIS